MPQKTSELEESILDSWDKNHIFKKSLDARKTGDFFSFFDGPPFATGLPHYGHILASTVKDVVGRYQTMQGRYVPRRWGWDCHGLPIENIVEQKLKISGKKEIETIGIETFNQTCRDTVLQYADEWEKTVRRIGRWVEFKNSYKTMDATYMESVWWAVKHIWDKDLIYEGLKVLLYCPRCETPISNFEVAMDNSYSDVTEESVFVKFKTTDKKFPKNTSFLAWTTTPWTLPSNFGLAVGPDIMYALVQQDNSYFILAKDRVSILEGEHQVIKEYKGKDLVGVSYEPLYTFTAANHSSAEKINQVHAAEFVTTEDGSGIVHLAPYGEDDFSLAQKNKIPLRLLVDHRGHFTQTAPEFLQGKYFKKADKLIKEDLTARNLLYKKQTETHSYPFCWRCATPLFYNPLPAWFINIQKIKPKLLKNNEAMEWYPGHLKTGRFQKGIENAPDWNISRNRYWATPLPFWRCENKECHHVMCIGSLEELQQHATNYDKVYASKNISEVDLHRPSIDQVKLQCTQCNGTMSRISEVIDCWVESASMPFAELHYPFENKEFFEKRFPADFVAEYIAQTRAWFYVTHVVSTILFDKAPFRNVVTTGNILNEKGEKLSKSKKNYPDPNLMIEKYGVDAMRFYMMSSVVMRADNLFFSERSLDEVYKKLVLIVQNVFSFYKLYPFEKDEKVSALSHILDQWGETLLQKLTLDVTESMEDYDFPRTCTFLKDFADNLSTWYLRRSRARLKMNDEGARSTFRHILCEFSKIIAPIMPFLADEIYKEVGGEKESVHLEDFPGVSALHKDQEGLLQKMDLTKQAATLALSIRAEKRIKVRQVLAELLVNKEVFDDILQEEVNVKEVRAIKKGAEHPLSYIQKSEGQLEVLLNIAMTPELQAEGWVREFIRQINQTRKKQGLSITDRTEIFFETDDENIKQFLQENQETILKETLSLSLQLKKGLENPEEIKLEKPVKVQIQKK